MDDFTRAVVCLYDPNASPQMKQSAEQFVEGIKNGGGEGGGGVWKFCMEKLFQCVSDENAARPEVMFWCETTLNAFLEKRLHLLSEEERKTLRQGLMMWVRDVCAKVDLQPYIKNKFAQILVTMIKLEYPHQWPSLLRELLPLLNHGERVIDLFLRVLKAIDEEIVNRMIPRTKEEQARHTEIILLMIYVAIATCMRAGVIVDEVQKDTMRVDCIVDIVNAWVTILQSGHTALTNQCLETMVNYIDWIDIALITTEAFAKLFYSFLSSAQFRSNACECLYMIVCKGMDHASKLSLVSNLQLPSLITNIRINSEEDETFAIAMSKLASAVAHQILEAEESLKENNPPQSQAARQMLDSILSVLYEMFNNNNDEVSAQLLPFFTARVSTYKKEEKFTQSDTQQIGMLLDIIKKKATYTSDFEFNSAKQSEYEAMLLEYRRDVFVLFKNIARIAPSLTKQYTMSFCMQQLNLFSQQGTNTPYAELEVALTLVFHIGEPLADEVNASPESNDFARILTVIVKSNVSSHPHMSVQIAYLEIVSRYSRLITFHQALITPVLQSFVDERGMRNANTTVSSRSSYLFLRLVKTLQPHLHPFINDLYQFTKPFLGFTLPSMQITEDNKSVNDKMFIYESLGSILSSEKVDPQTRMTIIESILQPLLAQMDEIVTKELFKQDTEENKAFSELLSSQIGAIAHLSKGFSKSTGRTTQATDSFKRVLEVIFKTFNAMPHDKHVREKVILYMHRMVALMGEEQLLQFFPGIINQLTATVYDAQQLKDVILLLNQVVLKCKQAAAPMADDMFLPLVRKVFQLIDNGTYQDHLGAINTISEEDRIKIDIHKTYFSLLQTLFKSDCASILTSNKNSGSLNQVLQTVVQGCKHPSIHVVRMCFGILSLIVSSWAGDATTNSTALPGFNKFVYETIIPVCFFSPLQSTGFDIDDATNRQALSDISAVLRTALKLCGNEFLMFMQQQFLPQLQLNPQEIADLLGPMQTAPTKKDFSKVLGAFVRSKRKVSTG